MPSSKTLFIQLTSDTVRARNLDLLPAGMVVKLHLGTIRTSTRGRNGQVDSVRGGPIVEFHGAHRNENDVAANVGRASIGR